VSPIPLSSLSKNLLFASPATTPSPASTKAPGGKGWALDKAAAAMHAACATSGVLDLGGQVLAFGEETITDAADPRDRALSVGRLRLQGASASTSGNSERGVTVNGRRIGHLFDPHTGSPAPDFGSVTVVASSGLTADVLSTAFFVLGPEKGLALSERLRGSGVVHETLFFSESEEGRGLRVSMSPGMRRLFSLSHSKKSSEGDHP
jgi:thiamine biosynthesis lipoprotein ApbE